MGMGGNGNGNGFMGMGGNGNRNSPSRTPLIYSNRAAVAAGAGRFMHRLTTHDHVEQQDADNTRLSASVIGL